MKVELIRQHIGPFVATLTGRDGDLHQYKYEILRRFKMHWQPGAEDFAAMYADCLESDVSRRWWKRDGYTPRESMLLLIKTEPNLIKKGFEALLNENHDVANRMDRFTYYCDEVLKMHKRADTGSIVNNHYQDGAIMSLYLSALYPDQYTLFPGRDLFNKGLKALGAQGTGEKDDLPRFFKVSRILYQYLTKEPSVSILIEKGLRAQGHLMLAHEFMMHLSGAWQMRVPE